MAVTQAACEGHANEKRVLPVLVTGLVCGPLALLAVLFRCYARSSTRKILTVDDWLAILALLFFIATVTTGTYSRLWSCFHLLLTLAVPVALAHPSRTRLFDLRKEKIFTMLKVMDRLCHHGSKLLTQVVVLR